MSDWLYEHRMIGGVSAGLILYLCILVGRSIYQAMQQDKR